MFAAAGFLAWSDLAGWELSVTVRLHDLVSSLNAEGQNYDRIRAVRTFLSGVLSDPTACAL